MYILKSIFPHTNMTIPKYNIHNIHKRLRSDLNNVIDELTMKINQPLSLLERFQQLPNLVTYCYNINNTVFYIINFLFVFIHYI